MIFIGVTGGIGSGKSLVCSLFAQRGIPVFHADDVAKEILANKDTIQKIADVFGIQVLDADGKPATQKLAQIVFSDKHKLHLLNSIIHPKVFEEFEQWKARQHQNRTYALAEAALIFESGMDEKLDYVLSVIANEQTRIERVVARDHSTQQEVKLRIANQLPDEELIHRSDFVIYNNKLPEDLLPQINFFHTLFSTLTQRKGML